MAFTLNVEFSGLCLYLLHPDGQHVAVLMPDCRLSTNVSLFHADGKDAEPHVGYVRLDMEDLGLSIPGTRGVEPRYELIHRLNRQVLSFEGARTPEAIDTRVLQFPSFDLLGFRLDLIPNLFTEAPPAELLARMVLDGGTLEANPADDVWELPQFYPSGPALAGKFASFATWTRAFTGTALTVRIRDFGSTVPTDFSMQQIPEGAMVSIKIANLCCVNPLEWSDLTLRQVKGSDVDFKWLYRLMTPRGTSYDRLLNGAELPHPRRLALPGDETGSDDCIAGTKTESFPV